MTKLNFIGKIFVGRPSIMRLQCPSSDIADDVFVSDKYFLCVQSDYSRRTWIVVGTLSGFTSVVDEMEDLLGNVMIIHNQKIVWSTLSETEQSRFANMFAYGEKND